MQRHHQLVLIVSTLIACWLGMQAVHEAGHVLGALATGGSVQRIELHPATISRTELATNPKPLIVVWAGPVFGITFPIILWLVAAGLKLRGAFVLRFFAGFCLIANGAYIGIGSFDRVGDCGEMLRHGSELWQLWLFGALTVPTGFWLWHRQGERFGLGAAKGKVDVAVTYCVLLAAIALLMLGLTIG